MINKDKLFFIMLALCLISTGGIELFLGDIMVLIMGAVWSIAIVAVILMEKYSAPFARWLYTNRRRVVHK